LHGFDPAIGEELHDLHWQFYDEIGNEVGVAEAPAPGFFLDPNESYTWRSHTPTKPGKYVIRVFYDGGVIGNTYFFVVEKPTIKEILDHPPSYDGKTVLIKAIYRGWKGEGEPPIIKSNWVITDLTGEIYVTSIYPHLDPIEDIGRELIVIGIVRVKDNIPYIEGKRIEHGPYESVGLEPGKTFEIRLTSSPFTLLTSPHQTYKQTSIQALVTDPDYYQGKAVAIVGRGVAVVDVKTPGPHFVLEGNENATIPVLGGIVEEEVWYPTYNDSCQKANGVRIGDMVHVYGTARSYLWLPITISPADRMIVCPPNTTYDWILKIYDPEYIEPMGESNPGGELNIFQFKALKEGNTEVVFAFCKLDSNGKTIEEIEVIPYEIGIHELKSVALTVTKKFVIRGMNFKISFPEVLHPGYGWILKSYDPEYVEYIGESYKAPLSGIIGTTTKVFIFKALKRGETEIVFADCELDRHGKPVEELKREKYIVKIY
jgi:hypothetical protein